MQNYYINAAMKKAKGVAPLTTISTHPTLPNGLISYWPFDENLNDVVGDNNATNHGADEVSGKINNGYEFISANSDYMTIADSDSLDVTNVSIALWYYHSTTAPDVYADILFMKGASYTGVYGIAQGYNHEDELNFAINNNDYYIDNIFPSVGWYHIVCTYDGTTRSVFVNDVLKGENTSVSGNINTDGNDIYVGGGASKRYVDGIVDEIGLWNRALTQAEVTALYNSGSGLGY